MAILRRVTFFMLVNFAIFFMLSFILKITGLNSYLATHFSGYQGLFIICLFWGTAGSFISLMISKWMAKKFMGVQLIEGNSRYSHIKDKVHHMSKAAGLSVMPEVGIFDSPVLNAFATGPSKSNSLVAVSTGLINNMNEGELDGVLGHEVSHIANGDMVTMTLIQGVLNAFVMFFASILTQIVDNAFRDENGRGGLGFFAHYFVYGIFQTVFGLLAMIPAGYFSRMREYRADAGGAALAGRDNMVSSLRKLKAAYPVMEQVNREHGEPSSAIAAMQISNTAKFMELFSTHPALDKRIAALEKFNT